jgi:hypothetical protein
VEEQPKWEFFQMYISSRNPSDMTAQERMDEIATLLARAVVRGKNTELNQHIERSLAGLQGGSKHSCDDPKQSGLRTKKKARA